MPKLVLQNITSGYMTQDQYNSNNALIEAALENTLSRDGTGPNTMGAALDMNSQDLNNVADINAQGGTINVKSLILDGSVIAVPTAIVLAPDVGAISYTPANPVGPVTTLQDALDDDYLRNDRDETITGTLIISGAASAASLSSDSLLLDSSRISADGLSVQRNSVETYTGVDWWIGRNVEVNGGVPQYGRAGDGWCQITMRTDTLDGLMTLSAGDNDVAAGTSISGNTNASIEIDGQTLSPAVRLKIEGVTVANFNASSLADNHYSEGSFTAVLTPVGGSITLFSTSETLRWTKIGRVVHVTGRLAVDTVAAPTGSLTIPGLPFTNDDTGTDVSYNSTSTVWASGLGGSPVTVEGLLQCEVAEGSNFIELYDGGGPSADHIQAGVNLYFNFFYFAAP